jgi:hypothetical protein
MDLDFVPTFDSLSSTSWLPNSTFLDHHWWSVSFHLTFWLWILDALFTLHLFQTNLTTRSQNSPTLEHQSRSVYTHVIFTPMICSKTSLLTSPSRWFSSSWSIPLGLWPPSWSLSTAAIWRWRLSRTLFLQGSDGCCNHVHLQSFADTQSCSSQFISLFRHQRWGFLNWAPPPPKKTSAWRHGQDPNAIPECPESLSRYWTSVGTSNSATGNGALGVPCGTVGDWKVS